MKSINLSLIVFIVFFIFTGCYHAQVTTGLEPSAQVYEQTFASAWIFGLVPPNVVRSQDECSNGVARVETRLSFVNMLVGNLTFGIYTPMHIKVTCAASRAELPFNRENTIVVNKTETENLILQAFSDAAEQAVKTRKPAYVEFR